MTDACDICRLLTKPDPGLAVLSTSHWQVHLAPDQHYLGRAYVTAWRHAGSLPELTDTEWENFRAVCGYYEAAVKKVFGATMFNWSCLLNDAYQGPNPQPHVQWQCRPRYEAPPVVDGIAYPDTDFGHHYRHDQPLHPERWALERIAVRLSRAR